MRGKRAQLIAAALMVVVGAPPNSVWALDLGLALPSALRLGAGFDDDGGYDYVLDLDQALSGGQRLLFTYGTSRAVGDDRDIEPRTLSVGASSDPLDRLTISARIEDWGQDDEITTRTVRADVSLQEGDWRFGLGAGLRHIEIFPRPTRVQPRPRPGESTSETVEFSIGVQVGERLYAAASYFDNDYSRDPDILDEAEIARRLSSVSFSLAAGLEEEGGALNASVLTGWGTASVDWSRSTSAVDGAKSTVFALGVDVDVSPAVTLQLSAGRQSTTGSPDLNLANAALLFSW